MIAKKQIHNSKLHLSDHIHYYGTLGRSWAALSKMGLKYGPIGILQEIKRYPWIWSLLKFKHFCDSLVTNRVGRYREANLALIEESLGVYIEILERILYNPDKVILLKDIVTSDIPRAMGLSTWMPELLGYLLPSIDAHDIQDYIDVSAKHGIPSDICSLAKSNIGISLSGHLPAARAMIASNMPCDGAMASYNILAQKAKIPMYLLDVPYNFYSEASIQHFVGQLKEMIVWLEQHTPGRMDWDLLREICEERNRASAIEYDLWDLVRARPAPMAAEPLYLGHLVSFIMHPGHPRTTRLLQRITTLARQNFDEGIGAIPNERHRVLVWNLPIASALDLIPWAEKNFGVSIVMDMLTFHPDDVFIDTSTPDTMLNGLARVITRSPMGRHANGPAENYFRYISHICESFSVDMIWMGAAVGCKNTLALSGLLKEHCRKMGLPLLIINFDLLDERVFPLEGMMHQVENFMQEIEK